MRKSPIFVLIALIVLFFIIINAHLDNKLIENKDVIKSEANCIEVKELSDNNFLQTHRWSPLYHIIGYKRYIRWVWGWKKI